MLKFIKSLVVSVHSGMAVYLESSLSISAPILQQTGGRRKKETEYKKWREIGGFE